MKSEEKVETKLGLVHQNNKGYYRLGNNKLLHREIWEKFYGRKIPKGYVIHHKDFNCRNNSISNLQLLTVEEHLKLHHKGKKVDDKVKEKLSKNKTTTGYFRVNKKPCPKCKQGFIYRYQYYDENNVRQSITSTNLRKLALKVQSKGLTWKKI